MIIEVNLSNPKEVIKIEFEIGESHERQMGVERYWDGIGYDSNGNEIRLTITEYPEGAYNAVAEKDKRIIESDEELGAKLMSLLHVEDNDIDSQDNSGEVKARILSIVNENVSKKPNLSVVTDKIMEEFEYTGIGVYTDIREMIEEGILKIDNQDLNNESIIEIN